MIPIGKKMRAVLDTLSLLESMEKSIRLRNMMEEK